MAAIKYIKRTVSLDGNSISEQLPASFYNSESTAHTFIIAAMRGGQPLTLSGAVSATFLNANDAVVLVSGSIVDGAAVVTLSNNCYALSGRFTLTIDVAGATVYECQGLIKRRSSGTAYDPSGEISVAELADEIAEMRTATAAANTAAAAADTARENIQGDINALKDVLNDSYVSKGGLPFVQGAYYAPDGSTIATTKAIRLSNMLPDGVVRLSCASGYKFNLWAWRKSDGAYIGHILDDGTFGKTNTYKFFTDYTIDSTLGYQYSVTFYKADNTQDISPSEGTNLIAYYTTDTTLSLQNKAADAKATGDKIKAISFALKNDLPFVQGQYIPSTGTTTVTNKAIRVYGMIPDTVIKLSCAAGYRFNVWAWRKSDNVYIGHIQANGTFGEADTYKYLTDYVIDPALDYKYSISVYNEDTSLDIAPSEGVNLIAYYYPGQEYIYQSSRPNFAGSPVTIFANDDSRAIANVDDGLLNTVSVIKVNDSLFYMYYEGYGLNGGVSYSDANLCFAYSTDGLNFTKGFPSGITPPISGSNVLLAKGSTHGHCVVKVPDSNYPYRMFTVNGSSSDREVKMWRSPDGINWVFVKAVTSGYNDSFISCVVRGNLLKLFLRTRDAYGRAIGTLMIDPDGNRFNASWSNRISLNNRDKQLYQAGASIWDDKREILFPTIYYPNTSAEEIGCMILDGDKCTKIDLDASAIMPSTIKCVYFASGIVAIGTRTYLYYSDRTSDHDSFSLGTTKSTIKRIELTDTSIPNVVRP